MDMLECAIWSHNFKLFKENFHLATQAHFNLSVEINPPRFIKHFLNNGFVPDGSTMISCARGFGEHVNLLMKYNPEIPDEAVCEATVRACHKLISKFKKPSKASFDLSLWQFDECIEPLLKNGTIPSKEQYWECLISNETEYLKLFLKYHVPEINLLEYAIMWHCDDETMEILYEHYQWTPICDILAKEFS